MAERASLAGELPEDLAEILSLDGLHVVVTGRPRGSERLSPWGSRGSGRTSRAWM
jgi:hypothetical protein